jgi:hypothetical protein
VLVPGRVGETATGARARPIAAALVTTGTVVVVVGGTAGRATTGTAALDFFWDAGLGLVAGVVVVGPFDVRDGTRTDAFPLDFVMPCPGAGSVDPLPATWV